MREKERLNILKQIEQEKNNMKILKDKLIKFQKLQESDIVKEYLELEDEVSDVDILNDDEIKQEVFRKQYRNEDCTHDVYFYIGGYIIEFDRGPESRDSYYREFDEDKIEYYSYYCLDCFKEVCIYKNEHEQFVKNNKIIRLKKSYITVNDFIEYQKKYYELLLENSTEEAIKKLVKEM